MKAVIIIVVLALTFGFTAWEVSETLSNLVIPIEPVREVIRTSVSWSSERTNVSIRFRTSEDRADTIWRCGSYIVALPKGYSGTIPTYDP
jgi:hypothetical protein